MSWKSWPRHTILVGALLISFGLGYLSHQVVHAEDAPVAPPYPELATFALVLSHIEQSYVDPVDDESLVYGAIKGMVRTLDPHSSFLTPEELQRMRTETRGEYVGVGMEIGVRDDEITVIVPFEGGPAFEAGIQPGDFLLQIDGETTRDRSVPDIVNQLRGEQGVPVEIRVRREHDDSTSQTLNFTVIRDVIHLQAVDSRLLAPGIGYISLSMFQANVTDDVLAAIDSLEVENGDELTGLILDLRNNPGGLLNEAIILTDIFLDEAIIVSTEGRNPGENETYSSRNGATRYHGPLAVLINGGTASASEIVAGALQDNDRASLVGTTTFGKATVQSIFNFEDGSGLKLTVARYFTPLHRSIHENGLVPDIEVFGGPVSSPALTDSSDVGDWLRDDGLLESPVAPFEPIDDIQIQAAFAALVTAAEQPPTQ